MALFRKILDFFVRDSAERRRFVSEFNNKASAAFQSMMIDSLFYAEICAGNRDNSFRHELSAPVFASGFIVKAKAGNELSIEILQLIGRIILSDQTLVRKMFVLHWDTLIVMDDRTRLNISWRIRDFLDFGGFLH